MNKAKKILSSCYDVILFVLSVIFTIPLVLLPPVFVICVKATLEDLAFLRDEIRALVNEIMNEHESNAVNKQIKLEE